MFYHYKYKVISRTAAAGFFHNLKKLLQIYPLNCLNESRLNNPLNLIIAKCFHFFCSKISKLKRETFRLETLPATRYQKIKFILSAPEARVSMSDKWVNLTRLHVRMRHEP